MIPLRIVQAKEDRALRQEQMAKLVSLKPKNPGTLSEQDWIDFAAASGIPVSHMMTVRRLESAGAGFGADGRLTILYEPHMAYKMAAKPRQAARIAPRLFYPKWISPGNVPRSEFHIYRTTQAERWQYLAQAAAIDFNAALSGTSWGLFQVLGKWGSTLGFRDAFHMVEHLYDGEAAHVDVFLRYCRRFNLIEPLRAGDWWAFSRYNSGSTYNRKIYTAKLMKAHEATRRALA